jgi:predicted nucleotidyltransferase
MLVGASAPELAALTRMGPSGRIRAIREVEMAVSLDQALVDEIVRRIVEVADPDRIILFGSAAVGRMTRDSDVDLLVLRRSPEDTRRESLCIRDALRGITYPFDVVVISTERFEESKLVVGGIAYPAHKYGRVIYEVA